MRIYASTSIAALTICLLTSGAHAQETPVPAESQIVEADEGDIIITAQRREERLQDVPASIAAFDGTMLEASGVISSDDLTRVIPGLNFSRTSFSAQPTIRGIGVRALNAGDESQVPIYLDGVYQPAPFAGFFELANIERVEVLRGPQGTLYGRNATGGAINIITQRPSREFGGRFSASYGRFDERILRGYLTGGAGPIAFDLAGVYYKDDGFIRDLVSGGMTGDRESLQVRGRMLWEITPNLEATLALGYVRSDDSSAMANQPINENTIARRPPNTGLFQYGTRPFESATDVDVGAELRQYSAALTLVGRFSGFNVTSISSYQNNRLIWAIDSDASTLNSSGFVATTNAESFYQEIYATSAGGSAFNWTVGGVYFHDDSGFDPLFVLAGSAVRTIRSRLVSNSFAAYAEGSYQFTDRLQFILGGRFTYERKDYQFELLPTRVEADASFSSFTPSGTLQYDVADNVNVYARIGQAFKSGLFNTAAASNIPVRPERVTQYEIGFKSEPARRVRFNVSAFYSDYTDLQLSARDPSGLVILRNAASAEIYGAEIEFQASPIRRLNLRAGATILRARYTDFPDAALFFPVLDANGQPIGGNSQVLRDASGFDLQKAPEYTFSLGGDYTFAALTGDVRLSANLYHSGPFSWETSNRIYQDPYTLVDAELSWSPASGAYRIGLWGRNLLNETYVSSVTVGAAADHQVHARPRTYGVRFEFNF